MQPKTESAELAEARAALEDLRAENAALSERVLACEYQSQATEMSIFATLKEKNVMIS